MADGKNSINDNLRSAQRWLKNAEEAFNCEANTKAQLQLMLAKAELQQVQEKSQIAPAGRSWRRSQHLLACAAAVGMLGLFGAGWLLKPAVTVPPPAMPTPALTAEAVRPEQALPQAALPRGPVDSKGGEQPQRQQAVVVEAVPRSAVVATVSGEATGVDKEEMQKIVRAAGKSLRGQ